MRGESDNTLTRISKIKVSMLAKNAYQSGNRSVSSRIQAITVISQNFIKEMRIEIKERVLIKKHNLGVSLHLMRKDMESINMLGVREILITKMIFLKA